jgi:hypothetical protein
MCPTGTPLTQAKARALAQERNIIIICGHYEGIDERVRKHLADEEVSIGDYVLTGGELPAMVLVDCLVRLVPGVLGDKKRTPKFNGCTASKRIRKARSNEQESWYPTRDAPPYLISREARRKNSLLIPELINFITSPNSFPLLDVSFKLV